MKYLLDTCVLLWALEGNLKKLKHFASDIQNPESFVFVSLASYWEMTIKRSLGRVNFEGSLSQAVEESGFIWLNIETHHIDYLPLLPSIHQDPFDRLLIAQAKVDKLTMLTSDEKILRYFEGEK